MKLTASLIVKNESALLGKCLASLKGVDEIVILDTGSSDNSIEIARQYGANVYHYKWNDDFSEARNEALKHCTGDWILSIDADEQLITPINRELLAGDAMTVEVDANLEQNVQIRLFRNSPGVYWSGCIHEQIHGLKDIRQSLFQIKCGSSPNHKIDPDRNLRILSKSSEVRHKYYLATEWIRRQDWSQAIECLLKYLDQSTPSAQYADGLFLLGLCNLNLGKMDEAMNAALRCIKYSPMNRSAWALIHNISTPINKRAFEKLFNASNNEGVYVVRRHLERLL